MNTIQLRGISFYRGTYKHCFSKIQDLLQKKQTSLIVTPNPEMLYEASRDRELAFILQKSDLAVPDGAGIFVAYQVTESRLPCIFKYMIFPYWCVLAILHNRRLREKYGERITGAKLTHDLLEYANKNNLPITLLEPVVYGNTPGDRAKKESQETLQETLQEKYPHTHIEVVITDEVPENIAKNGIVLATHGNGKQEKLLWKVQNTFPQAGMLIGVGGSIDLITGFRSSAPDFFQRFGGEWLYRLYRNPSRHWKRMKKVMNFLLDQITV